MGSRTISILTDSVDVKEIRPKRGLERGLHRAGWISMLRLEWLRNAVEPPGSADPPESTAEPLSATNRPQDCAGKNESSSANGGERRCRNSSTTVKGGERHVLKRRRHGMRVNAAKRAAEIAAGRAHG